MNKETLERILAPICPEEPSGPDLTYSREFDEIRTARAGDDQALSQGEWVRPLKSPQWALVRDRCESLLAGRVKDLQLAAWHVEALTRLEGFKGFRSGLQVIHGLLEGFWDTLHPACAPQDLDERASKIEWLDKELPLALRSAPMTHASQGSRSWLHAQASSRLEGMPEEARGRAQAVGAAPAGPFEKSALASGATFYRNLSRELGGCLEETQLLQDLLDARFGSSGPMLREIRRALEDCRGLASHLLETHWQGCLQEKGRPPEGALRSADPLQADPSALPGPVLAGRAEAVESLRAVARWFMAHEPHSPVAPLVERAARWSGMPFSAWLSEVIKDEATLARVRELLDLT